MDSSPVLDWTYSGVPSPSRSPKPPWPLSVIVCVSPLGRYGGLGAHAAPAQDVSSVLKTEPSPLSATTGPVTALEMTFSPDPSTSANTGAATPSPTKSIDAS